LCQQNQVVEKAIPYSPVFFKKKSYLAPHTSITLTQMT